MTTQTLTYGEALAKSGFSIPPHLMADAEVPTIVGAPQAQGDLLIIPESMIDTSGVEFGPWKPVQLTGECVVNGESSGGHRHDLHSYIGTVEFARVVQEDDDNPIIMRVRIPAGGVASFIHSDEHGANAAGAPADCAAVVVITGKREFADRESRRVAD